VSPVPYKPTVYILLITQTLNANGATTTAIGPVYASRIDADRQARVWAGPNVSVEIVEREVRGDWPALHPDSARAGS